MDYIPSEMLRGHLDTIILLSLIDSDKHTNQIKQVVESRSGGKFVLKQGTFYSCLQRITKAGYVTEYRTTDEDGVRRKFFQLTEKGKSYIEDNKDSWSFSKKLIDILTSSDDNDANEPIAQTVEENDTERDDVAYESVSSDAIEHTDGNLEKFLSGRIASSPQEPLKRESYDLSAIDFTQAETSFPEKDDRAEKKPFEQLSIVVDQPEPEKAEERAEIEPIIKDEKSESKSEREVKDIEAVKETATKSEEREEPDYIGYSTDYKTVLQRIFPPVKQPLRKETREITYDESVDINKFFNDDKPQKKFVATENKQQKSSASNKKQQKQETVITEKPKESEVKKSSFYDFSDIIELADEEGFKIKISSKDNKKDIGRILINKLNLYTSLVYFSILFVEIMIVYFATHGIAELKFLPYLICIVICALLPIANAVFYMLEPKKKVRTISSFKNAIELTLIICLNLLLIDVVCCVLGTVDFSSYKEITRYLVYPFLIIINVPLYVVIKYLSLERNKFFE